MLSCLNLIGWDGWMAGVRERGEGQAGEDVNAAFTSYGNNCEAAFEACSQTKCRDWGFF